MLKMKFELQIEKWVGMEPSGPNEKQGNLREGREAVYDFPHTVDFRRYDGIGIVAGAVAEEDLWLDISMYPLPVGRPEFIEKTTASVCIPKGGGFCQIPFSSFDHSQLVSAHMKYISSIKLLLRREKEEHSTPVSLQIEKIIVCTASRFCAEALCPSVAGNPHEKLTWTVCLENDTDKELLLTASEIHGGRESFSLEYEKKVRLAAGEVQNVTVRAILPEEMAPGGFEVRTLQWVPCGIELPEQRVTLYAARKCAHPFLLHNEDAWEYLRRLIGKDAALAEQFEKEFVREADRFDVPEPSADIGYVYISDTQNSFLKTAIAWKLTQKKAYLDKLLTYFHGFLDEKKGYLSTQYTYFQFVQSQDEWKKDISDCPFPVHRACNAGWVQEGEFMQKIAIAYDLIYDREEFLPEMHRRMECCMRAYMEFADWRLTDGDGNNFQLAEASAALYFACMLQDYSLIRRFLDGVNGLYELMGAVFSDDGSYFEGATNYVRLAAEILLHAANACENFGLNLKDMSVPASYDCYVIHAPWARRQEWAEDGKPFLGMNFERFIPAGKPVRRLKDFMDQLTTLLTPEGILFSVNDSNEQSLIPIMEFAYYLYEDSAYAQFRDEEQDGNFLFGLHMAEWKIKQRKDKQDKGIRSRLVEGGGFAVLRERKEHFYQAVIKYGQHGGYHGHFDRLSLVSFLCDNHTFHNQEFAWYGYDSFLFKMWVQTSVAHNMVVVDRKMQEPASCECIYFEEQEHFSAVCAQTVCRWSDPPYGGQTPYPMQFPEEKCQKEGRFVLMPSTPRSQGEIGDYSEQVFQRRFIALAEGCLYVWDYLEAEGQHEFDCLYHPFGSVAIAGMRHQRHTDYFDRNPFGAAQFVTDCHWYEKDENVVRLSFFNQHRRVNPNDRIDFIKYTNLFGVFPPEGHVMVGRYPGRSETFQKAVNCPEEDFLKDDCRKVVSFHQEGNCARFVTVLEIGQEPGKIRDIQCEAYGKVTVRMKDGSRRRITVTGMDDRSATNVLFSYSMENIHYK